MGTGDMRPKNGFLRIFRAAVCYSSIQGGAKYQLQGYRTIFAQEPVYWSHDTPRATCLIAMRHLQQ